MGRSISIIRGLVSGGAEQGLLLVFAVSGVLHACTSPIVPTDGGPLRIDAAQDAGSDASGPDAFVADAGADAGSDGDAGTDAAMVADAAVDLPAPRLVYPPSGSNVSTNEPTLIVSFDTTTAAQAHIEFCADPSCATAVAEMDLTTTEGRSVVLPTASFGAARVVFWRARARTLRRIPACVRGPRR